MTELLQRINADRRASLLLKIISHACALACAVIYIFTLVYTYLSEPMHAGIILAVSAFGFVLVSVVRRIINAPRPYEKYDFYEVLPKQKCGSSFPSRHVFSAFIIGTLAFAASPFLAIPALLMGLLMAVCRVLLGIHYIRDVAVGALVGAVLGIIGIIIIHLI